MTAEPISQPQPLTPRAEGAIQYPAPANTIRCGGCDAWWTGAQVAHCGACHRTFTRVSNFDRHRRGGECRHPTEVGLALTGRAYPCWAAADHRYLTLSDEETP